MKKNLKDALLGLIIAYALLGISLISSLPRGIVLAATFLAVLVLIVVIIASLHAISHRRTPQETYIGATFILLSLFPVLLLF